MLCYRDRAWCTAKDCENMDCGRNTNGPEFTPDKFWEDKICYIAFHKMCSEYKKKDGTDECVHKMQDGSD